MRAVLAAALRRLADRLVPQQPLVVHIELEGEQIVRAIKLRNRRRGLPPGTI